MSGFMISALNEKGKNILREYIYQCEVDRKELSTIQRQTIDKSWKIEITNNSYLATVKRFSKVHAISTFLKNDFNKTILDNVALIHGFFSSKGGENNIDYFIEVLP